MIKSRSATVWIGLADLTPSPGNTVLEGAPGACSNVLCLARDEPECRRVVREAFAKEGFEVRAFHDVEPLARRRGGDPSRGDVSKEILALANQLSEREPVVFDTLYVYESEDDGDVSDPSS